MNSKEDSAYLCFFQKQAFPKILKDVIIYLRWFKVVAEPRGQTTKEVKSPVKLKSNRAERVKDVFLDISEGSFKADDFR